MFRYGLNKDIREAFEKKEFSSFEELIESALLAENRIEKKSSTVDEYVDFFINHDVYKKHDATTLMSMFCDCLKEEIREALGNTEFSPLEELLKAPKKLKNYS
ncbi:hypothetical protein Bca52824_017039 [Brassica carinata]|uniref:Uncharacterized protein n=1 Tax=Brassica carinata TaxID=52824 RepID=A0A8X8AXV6_BRACI|nr:hypothetical protein Bca52824_017039 [Brassica carinata]